MTFPGVSIMEWMVGYGRDLAMAKSPAATNITHLPVGPKLENTRNLFKRLLFGVLWPAKRSRVSGMAIILVQVLRDRLQVLRCPRLTP